MLDGSNTAINIEFEKVRLEYCPQQFMEKNEWTEYAKHFLKNRETSDWRWAISEDHVKGIYLRQIVRIADSVALSLRQKIGILCRQFSSVLAEVPAMDESNKNDSANKQFAIGTEQRK